VSLRGIHWSPAGWLESSNAGASPPPVIIPSSPGGGRGLARDSAALGKAEIVARAGNLKSPSAKNILLVRWTSGVRGMPSVE